MTTIINTKEKDIEDEEYGFTIEYFENWYLDDACHFFHEIKEYCGYHPTIFEYLRMETFHLFIIELFFEGGGSTFKTKKQFGSFLKENYKSLDYLYIKFYNFFNYFIKKYKLKHISFHFNDFLTFCVNYSNVKMYK